MTAVQFTRRLFVMGAVATLPGCSTLNALSEASSPLPTFDLLPVTGATSGRRTNASFLVAKPVAPAVLDTDRWLIRPDAVSITYLPDARWPENLPTLVQSLMIRSLSSTGRIGFVGPSGEGPVPDFAVLSRIDAFEIAVTQATDGSFENNARIKMNLTIVRDANQRVIASRSFEGSDQPTDLGPAPIVSALQRILDPMLLDMTNWIIQVSR